MWLSLLPTVLKTGASVFANRQKQKILLSEAELLHTQKMANGEIELEKIVRQDNNNGYKDEFVLILISMPVLLLIWSVFSDDPNIQAKIDMFFDKFSNLPFWYQGLFIGICSAIYGLRGADYLSKKK
jgi:hypothetical protein